jgi:hypothetical protein
MNCLSVHQIIYLLDRFRCRFRISMQNFVNGRYFGIDLSISFGLGYGFGVAFVIDLENFFIGLLFWSFQ